MFCGEAFVAEACTRARLGLSVTIAGERRWFRANSGFFLTSCETKHKNRTPVNRQIEIVSA
jgi:hypothetical protein